jgi:hypothetical protein
MGTERLFDHSLSCTHSLTAMRFHTFPLAVIIFSLHFVLIAGSANTEAADEAVVHDFFNRHDLAGASESSHTNNWAVLVCASRYWFNYRVRTVCYTVLQPLPKTSG